MNSRHPRATPPSPSRLPSCIVGISLVLIAGSAIATPWQVSLDAGATWNESAQATALDSAGMVLAAGSVGHGLTVTKRDPATGSQQWTQTIPGNQPGVYDGARALAVDAQDDVVAAGSLTFFGTESDFAVAKLDGVTGQVLWSYVPPGAADFQYQAAWDVVVDSLGNVYATGALSDGAGADLFVVKLDGATGQTLWSASVDGSSVAQGNPGQPFDVGNRLALDGAGGVVVVGSVMNQSSDFIALRFDAATGNQLWRFDWSKQAHMLARGLHLASNGDVLASGSLLGDSGFVLRVAVGANQAQWIYVDDGNGYQLGGFFHDVDESSQGDVVATGTIDYGITCDNFTVASLDPANGLPYWSQAFNAGICGNNGANAAVLDGAGDIYVAGRYDDGSDRYFAVRKLSGGTGATQWLTVTNGTAADPLDGIAYDLVLDGAGGLFAAGWVENASTGEDFTVVRIEAETGKGPKVVPVEDLGDIVLIPLWDNWLLWLRPVEDLERAREEAIDSAREGGPRVTTRVEDLLHLRDTALVLVPEDSQAALEWILQNRDRLAKRSAPATLIVKQGSEAHHLGLDLAAKAAGDAADRNAKIGALSSARQTEIRVLSEATQVKGELAR